MAIKKPYNRKDRVAKFHLYNRSEVMKCLPNMDWNTKRKGKAMKFLILP